MKPKTMKATIIKTSLTFLLLTLIGGGCEKKEDEWIIVNSSTPNTEIINQLDLIFSEENNCLLNFQTDTVLYTIFTPDALTEMDNCNSISGIDFGNYTLIAGKIMVASISDRVSDITLTSNSAEDVYKLEVSIDKCEQCFAAIGHLYFWRLYPKLNSKYKIELSVTEK